MIGLIFGQLLVWGLGGACVALLMRRSEGDHRNAVILGYGYPVGTVALTLLMRAESFAGIGWSWWSVGFPLLAGTALATWCMPGGSMKILHVRGLLPGDTRFAGLSARVSSLVWWTLLALIALHLVLALLEIIWRPLFPWDAWTQWATKARVWYETLRMTPFADATTWFAGGVYTDAIPGYPANVPLLQVWACITLGRWDDSLMNVPYFCLAASLALAFHGQLRAAGCNPILSLAGAYAVISLPLLDTHVALAGYADLPLAVYFGLGAIALWRWAVTREKSQLVLAVILAIACPFTKHPGWLWMGVMFSAVVVTTFPRRGMMMVSLAIVVAIIALAIFGHTELNIGGYRLGAFRPVWQPLLQNYFEFANWHLLWFLLPALMVASGRRMLKPEIVAGTAVVASGLAVLFVVFSFTSAAAFVEDYSTVNRATLHLAPLLIFYIFRLADVVLLSPTAATREPLATDPGSVVPG